MTQKSMGKNYLSSVVWLGRQGKGSRALDTGSGAALEALRPGKSFSSDLLGRPESSC